MSKLFNPISQEEEYEMLTHDDGPLSATTAYLENLILAALGRFIADESEKTTALKNLKEVIPLVASRYLGNENSKEHKFSVYYSWYIQQEIAKYDWKKVGGK